MAAMQLNIQHAKIGCQVPKAAYANAPHPW